MSTCHFETCHNFPLSVSNGMCSLRGTYHLFKVTDADKWSAKTGRVTGVGTGENGKQIHLEYKI